MNDSLLDDVKALLDKDLGDDRILKQICRACENDEVISNYERNYVRKLAENIWEEDQRLFKPKHLFKKNQMFQMLLSQKLHLFQKLKHFNLNLHEYHLLIQKIQKKY